MADTKMAVDWNDHHFFTWSADARLDLLPVRLPPCSFAYWAARLRNIEGGGGVRGLEGAALARELRYSALMHELCRAALSYYLFYLQSTSPAAPACPAPRMVGRSVPRAAPGPAYRALWELVSRTEGASREEIRLAHQRLGGWAEYLLDEVAADPTKETFDLAMNAARLEGVGVGDLEKRYPGLAAPPPVPPTSAPPVPRPARVPIGPLLPPTSAPIGRPDESPERAAASAVHAPPPAQGKDTKRTRHVEPFEPVNLESLGLGPPAPANLDPPPPEKYDPDEPFPVAPGYLPASTPVASSAPLSSAPPSPRGGLRQPNFGLPTTTPAAKNTGPQPLDTSTPDKSKAYQADTKTSQAASATEARAFIEKGRTPERQTPVPPPVQPASPPGQGAKGKKKTKKKGGGG